MIQFKNVSFGYDRDIIVKNLSFSLSDGEFTAMIGSNGAGKSTTARLLDGLLKPSSGCIEIDGEDTKKLRASALARKIGFLFQNPDRQLCRKSVREELEFSLECVYDRKKHGDMIARAVDDTLAAFTLDGGAAPFELSRGQRQKLALASVVIRRPELIILDEPTTGLDCKECMSVMEIVRSLNIGGMTVFMICHDMEIVLDFAQRALVMNDGTLTADGDVRDIFNSPEILSRASLLPPQIGELSRKLGEAFHGILTVDEMTAKLCAGMTL